MLTVDTITDEQIRELRAEANRSGDEETRDYCDIALGRPKSFHLAAGRPRDPSAAEIERTRSWCAEILNARKGHYAR